MEEQAIQQPADIPAGTPCSDPREQLFALLALIKGGYRVPESVVFYDYMEWVAIHGEPTAEAIERWAADNFEVEFALAVLKRREGWL